MSTVSFPLVRGDHLVKPDPSARVADTEGKGSGGWKCACSLPFPSAFSCYLLLIPFLPFPYFYFTACAVQLKICSLNLSANRHNIWFTILFNSPNPTSTTPCYCTYAGKSQKWCKLPALQKLPFI